MPVLIAVVAGAIGTALTLIFGPLYLAIFRRELARADEMERVARSLGLAFSRTDPAYPGATAFRFAFELFSRGVEQTCENFMTGRSGGLEIVAFDFLYRQRFDSDGAPHNDIDSEPIRWSCALAAVGGWRPHVVIELRRRRARCAPTASRWVSSGATSMLATASSHPTADSRPPFSIWSSWPGSSTTRRGLQLTWEVQRDQILCRAPELAPAQYSELLRATAEFARRISRGASG